MAKVLISLPDELPDRIDSEVRAHGGDRSGFFQDAAHRRLGRPTAEQAERSKPRSSRHDRYDERMDAGIGRGRAAHPGPGHMTSRGRPAPHAVS